MNGAAGSITKLRLTAATATCLLAALSVTIGLASTATALTSFEQLTDQNYLGYQPIQMDVDDGSGSPDVLQIRNPITLVDTDACSALSTCHIGFYEVVGGGIEFTGYLDNTFSASFPSYMTGELGGTAGEKPDGLFLIIDPDGGDFMDVVGGSLVFDPNVDVYHEGALSISELTPGIELDGVVGDISSLPEHTFNGPVARMPHTVVLPAAPEPAPAPALSGTGYLILIGLMGTLATLLGRHSARSLSSSH